MSRFSSFFVFVVSIIGVYTALGYGGVHDYWIPLQKGQIEQAGNYWKQKIGFETDQDQSVDGNIHLSPREELSSEPDEPGTIETESSSSVSKDAETEGQSKASREKESQKNSSCLSKARATYTEGDQKSAKRELKDCLSNEGISGETKSRIYYHLARFHKGADRVRYLKQLFSSAPEASLRKKGLELHTTMDPEQLSLPDQLLFRSFHLIHNRLQAGEESIEKTNLSRLNKLSKGVFRSDRPFLDSVSYTVESGDSLDRIGAKYSVGVGWVNWTNRRPVPVRGNQKARRIIAGKSMRIFPGSFYMFVSIPATRLDLFYIPEKPRKENQGVEKAFPSLDGLSGVPYFVQSFPAGIGKPLESPTPTGVFRIVNKTIRPDWTKPDTGELIPYGDPDNILGTRWMGFDESKVDGYGIHGTTRPETIGKKVSGGCIRLRNKNVERLYDILPGYLPELKEADVPIVEVVQ